MISSTRAWLKRNRYPLAIGAGIVGAGYVAGQYVLSKLQEARVRSSDDRVARENIRRRFAQNQEDCTYTILALLPTATENIVAALPVERVTGELQARRDERVGGGGGGGGGSVTTGKSSGGSEVAPSEGMSVAGDEESASVGAGSSGFVHASRVAGVGGGGDSGEGEGEWKGKTKTQLWNDVKIYSLTRAFTLIYTLSLLTLLTRIQLNLLGRRSYLSSVLSLASPSPTGSRISLENHDNDASPSNSDSYANDYGSDFDTNRMYLTFSWWLLHRGWRAIRDRVEAAVRQVFGGVTPRDNVSFGDLAEMVVEVRKRVEGRTEGERAEMRWLPFMLPEEDQEEAVLRESGMWPDSNASGSPVDEKEEPRQHRRRITPSLKRLLDETADIIDSPTFSQVLARTLDAQFSLLVEDKIAALAYKIPPVVFREESRLDDLNPANFFQGDEMEPGLAESRVEEVDSDEAPAPLSKIEKAKATTCKLATTLAVLTRQANVIGSSGNLDSLMASAAPLDIPGMPTGPGTSLKDANEYLAVIDAERSLEAFAAVVYSSNFELEGVDALEKSHQAGEKVPDAGDVAGSFVDAGKDLEGSLESAWGKAVAGVKS